MIAVICRTNPFNFNLMVLPFILLTMIGCKKDLPLAEKKYVIEASADTNKLQQTQQRTPVVAFFDANLDKYGTLAAYQKVAGSPYSAMVINPGRISVTQDPVYGKKRKVMLMDVRPTDTGGLTDNPRAQVQTPMSYTEGESVYVGFSVRFTDKLWTYFLTFSEFYGAPYSGSSPFRLSVQADNIVGSVTGNGKQYNLWKTPLEPNQWYDFVYHECLSANVEKGLVEVWMRRQGEKHFTQLILPTKLVTLTKANNGGPNYHKLACYYDKNNTFTNNLKLKHVPDVKVYFANHKVGSSFKSVAPQLLIQ